MRINICNKFLIFFAVITFIFMQASCVGEDITSGNETDGEAMVTFTMQVPGTGSTTSGSQSRMILKGDENTVNEIDVLIFKPNGGQFVYKTGCTGSDIITDESDSGLKTFVVKMLIGEYDLVMFANSRSIINATELVGKNKNTVVDLLNDKMPDSGKWPATSSATFTPFRMWGNIGTETIDKNTAFTGDKSVKLTRAIARVDVKLDAAVDNFELTSVDVYNYNVAGSLAPKASEWDTGIFTPNVPSLALKRGPLKYNNEDGKEEIDEINNKCVGEIYLFEAENHTDVAHATKKNLLERTCLVVGGKYNGDSKPTYYRIDFVKEEEDTQKYLDVLRNYKYVFSIGNVSGPGYEDSETAFKSTPINIEAEVLDWNTEGGDVEFDGQYYLSVKPDAVFNFTKNASSKKVVIETDVPTGWEITKITDAGGTPVTWPTTDKQGGGKGETTEMTISVGENLETSPRTAYIYIKAGRMETKLIVNQSVKGAFINFMDSYGNIIDELVFPSKAGIPIFPETQSLIVSWEPKNATVYISNTTSGIAFPLASNIPASDTKIVDGNNGTGTITYYIKPPAFTEAELEDNPFLEKYSVLVYVEEKAAFNGKITLRQINYNLLADTEQYYLLIPEAQTKTMNVRANFNWVITKVTDNNDILQNENDLIELSGGNNKNPGDPVTFTLAAGNGDGSKDNKSATITFTNTANGDTYDVTILSSESMYVGYFDGKLVEKEPGVWQFERKLFVQTKDEPQKQWAIVDATTNMKNMWDGKGNTYTMRSTAYPAANWCYQKNTGYRDITGIDDARFVWYLPAQQQLMAIWVANNTFYTSYKLIDDYWSSTEALELGDRNDETPILLPFATGEVRRSHKHYAFNLVRCVKGL